MTEQNGQAPERWGIVAVLGHQERIGRISEAQVAGGPVLQVDIPLADGSFSTRHLGHGAIYEITYTDEATARALATARPAHPVSIWTAKNLGLLGIRAADDPDERALGVALTFRQVEWQPATCAWPGCEVILTSLGEARAHMAEHESMGRRIPVSQEAWAPPVFDGAGEDGHT